jgi:aconitate hydratase
LPEPIQAAVDAGDLTVASVLSGNRNFEGRVHASVRANYLASPPLVVAYAIAGRVDFDPRSEPLATGSNGKPVFLKDIWPTQKEVRDIVQSSVKAEQFTRNYANVYAGDEAWRKLEVPKGATYAWDPKSTYVKEPPYFAGLTRELKPFAPIREARVLALLGDSVTTDHISPAGSIKPNSPAGEYLVANGVERADFNQYGARRGNHEVMVRGTFANVRLRNKLLNNVEGGESVHLPSGEQMSIFATAERYAKDKTALVVVAGKEYGSGSSRDWAAKGPYLQGVRAVIAESFERIHRSNLVGMGIVPLQFFAGETPITLGLDGREFYEIVDFGGALESGFKAGREIEVRARAEDGKTKSFRAKVRIDTPQEVLYMKNGGILQFVLRKLLDQPN